MTDRDRLIELIQNAVNGCARHWAEIIADYLLANGVIVPQLKAGDKVYQIDAERVYELDILCAYFYKRWIYETKGIDFDIESIGKSIFLTKEEAEKALKEREGK